jgi:hypothetical protein
MAFMPRALKTLAVLLLIALVPMRAVAGVTIGFCASGHNDVAVAAHAADAPDAGAHAQHGNDLPAQPVEPSCNICAEHCSSAAFAPSTDVAVDAWPIQHDRIDLAGRNSPAYFPDQLDRPPLA